MNLTNYDRRPVHLISDSYARLCVSEPASVLVVKNLSASANTFYGSIGWVDQN